jgi:hypothetical protein
MANKQDKWVLLHGGPSNGFDHYGPFDTEEDAISYAEFLRLPDSWWICSLFSAQRDDNGEWIDPFLGNECETTGSPK